MAASVRRGLGLWGWYVVWDGNGIRIKVRVCAVGWLSVE